MTKGLLVGSDGSVFSGVSVGAPGTATGEIVFNTAMTGYQEIVTDPSYTGQVVVLTAPHVGNYGVSSDDAQSPYVRARGLVTRSTSRHASSWRSESTLSEYLVANNVVALSEVDTRRLTRHIRDNGAMSVAIGVDVDEAELAALAAGTPSMAGQDLASTVSTDAPYTVSAESERVGHVVAYDFGIKQDILSSLQSRGLDVTVVPSSTSAEDALQLSPDAVFLSNGPGDPEPLSGPIEAIQGLLGSVPVFGICLGHQLLGRALGAETFKLPFGHHGGNHPVRRMSDGAVAITSQNHGFAVDLWSLTRSSRPVSDGLPGADLLPAHVETQFGEVAPTHQNLNDGTNEGMECRDVVAFSVQYHPEAAPGPNDAEVLFDRFASVIGGADA